MAAKIYRGVARRAQQIGGRGTEPNRTGPNHDAFKKRRPNRIGPEKQLPNRSEPKIFVQKNRNRNESNRTDSFLQFGSGTGQTRPTRKSSKTCPKNLRNQPPGSQKPAPRESVSRGASVAHNFGHVQLHNITLHHTFEALIDGRSRRGRSKSYAPQPTANTCFLKTT